MQQYRNPVGGTRQPTPRPAPKRGHIPMLAWRQPVGGVKPSSRRP